MPVLEPVRSLSPITREEERRKAEAEKYPENPEAGCRQVTFSVRCFIEREDFREDPPRVFPLSHGNVR
jgi:glutaminyl-tRNA synthetase